MKSFLYLGFASLVFLVSSQAQIIQLEQYNIEPGSITVSGISSGACMATQMHVIWSSYVSGAALFAGVPYYCAQGDTLTSIDVCMNNPDNINTLELIQATDDYASAGDIDPTNNLNGDNVYIFAGTLDSTVQPEAGPKIEEYYNNYGASIETEYNIDAEHCQPTDDYGASCDYNGGEYINDCNYDGAYTALSSLYGPLAPSALVASGQFSEFDQDEFLGIGSSMDSSGYIYIPTNCIDKQTPCKLHMALHGCDQGKYALDDTFALETGYVEAAESNDIIVIFPQAVPSGGNGFGCWDWWGYTNQNYATQDGIQPLALYDMLARINEGI